LIRFRRLRLLCLLAFVLPVLALRALVPAGFMAAPVDGTLQIVLCQPGAMAGHHHHPGSPASGPALEVDPTCPYAQSAGPALMPTLPVLPAVAMMHRPEPPEAVTQTRLNFGPLRQQFPRGPPTLA
jgi:hypothetical protein